MGALTSMVGEGDMAGKTISANKAAPAKGARKTVPPKVRMLPAAAGHRAYFFDDPAIDKVYTMLLALMSEVSVLRERVDAHERLAAQGEVATPERVDAYMPSEVVAEARDFVREEYVRRIFKVLAEEAARLSDPSYGEAKDYNKLIKTVRGK